MMEWPRAPLLLEINAFPWLRELEEKYGRSLTLADIPAGELAALELERYDALWLMGVWERSPASRDIAGSLDFLTEEYKRVLPDFTLADVCGSPFAIRDYVVDSRLGGAGGLAVFREQLASMGVRLILDFIPNHFGLDHPWLTEHPHRFLQGTPLDLRAGPDKYFSCEHAGKSMIFAHGRALYTSVWTDTVQLDYRRKETREAMAEYLLQIACLCDGVRCDMAMLCLKEIFLKTWQGRWEGEDQFWTEVITAVKSKYPGFLMIGEVYWDYEHSLQQLGFDFVYDKVLYDRVLGNNPGAVFSHLSGGSLRFQARLTRFIENHDERRVVEMVGIKHSLAAATLVATLPGMPFFHEGQTTGCRVRLPVQLGRRPLESPLASVKRFYGQLLAVLRTPLFRKGHWKLLVPRNTAPDNSSHKNIIASLYSLGEETALVVVNLVSVASQCFLVLGHPVLNGRCWLLKDQLSEREYRREGGLMNGRGLFLDLPGFGYHIFRLETVTT